MGILIGPIYIIGIWIYYLWYRSIRKAGKSIAFSLFLTFLTSLPFTYDIVITHALSSYHCMISSSDSKTQIVKKIEYPESVYWEDIVYRGFDHGDRILMILNYLDGDHIKTIALNAPDGIHVHLYTLNKPQWDEFKKEYEDNLKKYPVEKDPTRGHSFDIYEAYAKEIMKNVQIYTKETMPKLNYTVITNEIKLDSFTSKFLYGNESILIDNKTNEIIASNRMYARFFYNIEFRVLGTGMTNYFSSVMCGNYNSVEEDAFGTKWRPRRYGNHQSGLNKYLFNTKEKK